MTDLIGCYNTVTMEMEVASLADWEKEMEKYKRGELPNMDPETMEAMRNYTDMYLTGKREVFQVIE
jgi:hypothetical protein